MPTFLSFATGLPGSISFGPQDDENGESEEHGGVPLPPPPPYEQPSNGMQCVDDLVLWNRSSRPPIGCLYNFPCQYKQM